MPESPEVQALVEFLDERVAGRAISALDVIEFRVVKSRDRLPGELIGARIAGVSRFGKHIGFDTSAGWLMIGFGRNGWVRWHSSADRADAPPAPEVMRIGLGDGAEMQIVETGDFLAVTVAVVEAPSDVAGIAGLGPDPLAPEFSPEDLERALGKRRKMIKALLQEQTSLAGIGNAYSDEILHRARLPHDVHAAALDDGARERLFQAVVAVMRTASEERRGVSPDRLKQTKVSAMAVHGRGGEPCPACGTTIVDAVFAGASAQFCPACQA